MRIERSALSPAYGFCDPHGGKADLSRVGSRAALIVGCADPVGRLFVLHAWAGRVTTVELMQRIEWDVHELVGEKLRFALVDASSEPMGHLTVDELWEAVGPPP